jgi:hypothetical protein
MRSPPSRHRTIGQKYFFAFICRSFAGHGAAMNRPLTDERY